MRTSTLDRMVEATPASRDRVVDFLRAASIVAVVIGHWFTTTNFWQGGEIYSSNMIGQVRGFWIVTWFLMVMPLPAAVAQSRIQPRGSMAPGGNRAKAGFTSGSTTLRS